MGFRTGAYATVWSVEPTSDTMTKARISTSRKDKQTGEYETDFNGFVVFMGTAVAKKAASLKEKDRIKLGNVDVTNKYNKEKNVTYTDFKIFTYENANGTSQNSDSNTEPQPRVDDGEIDESDSRLPF